MFSRHFCFHHHPGRIPRLPYLHLYIQTIDNNIYISHCFFIHSKKIFKIQYCNFVWFIIFSGRRCVSYAAIGSIYCRSCQFSDCSPFLHIRFYNRPSHQTVIDWASIPALWYNDLYDSFPISGSNDVAGAGLRSSNSHHGVAGI